MKLLSTTTTSEEGKELQFDKIDYNFVDCCRAEYVLPRCQRLCSFQQLASRYQSINVVHECYSVLPSITRCMVAGRNNTDCCRKRHIPDKCNPMCGHQGDTAAMSVQDQSYCADYSATIMSCKYPLSCCHSRITIHCLLVRSFVLYANQKLAWDFFLGQPGEKSARCSDLFTSQPAS